MQAMSYKPASEYILCSKWLHTGAHWKSCPKAHCQGVLEKLAQANPNGGRLTQLQGPPCPWTGSPLSKAPRGAFAGAQGRRELGGRLTQLQGPSSKGAGAPLELQAARYRSL